DATAYVYFTSGTTGTPKGVMASYGNLQHYILVALARYDVSTHDVMPAIARFSFSISMFELMAPLAAGGTLVVLDRVHVMDMARLAPTLATVTFFHAGPSLLKKLLPYIEQHYADSTNFDGVRHASLGGDLIAPDLLETVKRLFRNAEVFVIYGCSEIACMGCTYPVRRDQRLAKTFVGRPFANTSVQLLDANLQPVPFGVVGEICFAGAGVAKGYLNRPTLTDGKFIQLGGQRWYRTGDMGRRGADGWVEILGRSDFQVKVRGMRIELGEVEFHLRQAPGVRDGVVVGQRDARDDLHLVAYVVLAPDMQPATVRRYLVDCVPDYMVPTHVVPLDALPVNQNLKVDRAALPPLVAADERRRQSRITEQGLPAPAWTATERELARLWCALLKRDAVALGDNFFELGADSLLAVNLLVDIERELGVVLLGIDVLRESLQVLATMCDQKLGRPVTAPALQGSAPPPTVLQTPICFGAFAELYGALHTPIAAAASPPSTAVLICGPVGHEVTRTHLVLTRLARACASGGVPALRFDYFACGDSAGDSIDATPTRWQQDIATAAAELRARTGALRVLAVGVRLGAALLTQAAACAGVDACVFWDPVWDGAAYAVAQAAMQQTYLRGTAPLRRLAAPLRALAPGGHGSAGHGHEMLGMVYSVAALRQLRTLQASAPATA
ncbi:MAG TPA: AMP-binding protein, partial [Kofleriaceae bacterium]|nr:AMP-binding protein [Kofleriaceae bacterium]